MWLEQCVTLGSGFRAGPHSGACRKKQTPLFFDPREWQDVPFGLIGSVGSAAIASSHPRPSRIPVSGKSPLLIPEIQSPDFAASSLALELSSEAQAAGLLLWKLLTFFFCIKCYINTYNFFPSLQIAIILAI